MAIPTVPAIRWFIADGLAATEFLPENAKKALAPYDEADLPRLYQTIQNELASSDSQLAQLLALNPIPQMPVRIFLHGECRERLTQLAQ